MKVFVVEAGEYEQRGVHGVYGTLEAAKANAPGPKAGKHPPAGPAQWGRRTGDGWIESPDGGYWIGPDAEIEEFEVVG